jgi:hypothetical protein
MTSAGNGGVVLRRRLRRRLARWISTEDEFSVAVKLGEDHPLRRALTLRRTLARQLLATVSEIPFAAIGVIVGVHRSSLLLGVTSTVALVLLLLAAFARDAVRDHSLRLLATGRDGIFLAVVADERRRLNSRKDRERLARSLEALLREAELPPRLYGYRSLPGTKNMVYVRAEAMDVIRLLRENDVRVQAVARISLLLTDGHLSALYAGNVELLRRELNSIRFMLERPAAAEWDRSRTAA